MTSTIHVRMDPALKSEAEAVFKEVGLDATTAVRMFYKKVAATRSIPFDLKADSRLERLLLEGLDSPAVPFDKDSLLKKAKQRLKERTKAHA